MRKATIGPVMSARPSISTEERLSDLTDFCEISYSRLLIIIFQNQSEITDYVYSCEWETVLSVGLEQKLKQHVKKYFAFYENINGREYIPFYVYLQLEKYSDTSANEGNSFRNHIR